MDTTRITTIPNSAVVGNAFIIHNTAQWSSSPNSAVTLPICDANLLINPDIPPDPALTAQLGEAAEAAPQTLRSEVPDAEHDGSAGALSSSMRGTILHKQVGNSNYTYVIDSAGEVWCWSPKTGAAQRLRGI